MGKGGTIGDAVLSDLTFHAYNADTGKFATNFKQWGTQFKNDIMRGGTGFDNISGAQGKRLANDKSEKAAAQAAVDAANAKTLANQQKQDKDVNASNTAQAARQTALGPNGGPVVANGSQTIAGQTLGADERDFLGL